MKRFISILLAACLCLSLVTVGVMAAEPAAPSNATRKGIDVSYAQGTINWAAVKDAGIDFAILQCGYGQDDTAQDDVQFLNNVAGCEKYGIPYGVYLYSYATTVTKAQGEADHALRLIRDNCGSMFQLPVYYDIENAGTVLADGVDTVAIANAFCSKIEAAGYQAGIYSNLNNWNGKLADSSLNQWYKWVAQYNTQCTYSGTYAIWQCTDSGTVDGIGGNVDINYMIGNPADHGSTTSTLTTDKSTYYYGEAIMTTATTNRGSAWVAIYGSNDNINSVSSYYWYYVNGSGEPYGRSLTWQSGKTYNIYDMIKTSRTGATVLPVGNYKVMLLAYDASGNYTTLASKDITIKEADQTAPSALATSKENYVTGEDVVITATSYKTNAWVGIYKSSYDINNLQENTYETYYYTAGNQGVAKSVGSLAAGTYNVILFADDTRYKPELVVSITVNDYLATDKSVYLVGEPIYVSTNYSEDAYYEWVGVYKSDEEPGSIDSISYYYIYYTATNQVGVDVTKHNDRNAVVVNRASEFNNPGTYKVILFNDQTESAYSSYKTVTFKIIKETGRDVTAPTCTSGGYTTVTYSDGSKKIVDETAALGHNYSSKTTAATCTTAGYTTYTCTRCSDSYIVTGDAAKGHSYKGVVTAPTCTAEGYTTFTCSVCKHTYSGAITDALGHNYVATVTPPTCTAAGYTTYICSVCQDSYTGNETAALGHDYVATVTPPTCTEAGYTTHVCSRDSSHTYTDAEVPATGHTWGEYTLTKAPTHTENGELTKTCTVCGAVHADVITVMMTPLLDLQIEFVDGRLVLTGIYDDYTNKTSYLSVLTHGIVLIPTASEGSAELSVNTNGRTKIEFNGFKTDGTVRYTFTPAGANVSYTVRAFVSYADPVTGEQVFAYSDILTGDYTTNQGQTLTTVRAD